jgi:hypothetical protein
VSTTDSFVDRAVGMTEPEFAEECRRLRLRWRVHMRDGVEHQLTTEHGFGRLTVDITQGKILRAIVS